MTNLNKYIPKRSIEHDFYIIWDPNLSILLYAHTICYTFCKFHFLANVMFDIKLVYACKKTKEFVFGWISLFVVTGLFGNKLYTDGILASYTTGGMLIRKTHLGFVCTFLSWAKLSVVLELVKNLSDPELLFGVCSDMVLGSLLNWNKPLSS